jgi:hypothetical protein
MRRRYQVVLFLAALATGCERPPEFAPVEGTITRGGRPAANIEVVFYADEDTRGAKAFGVTDAQGRYRLQTEAGQNGAVVGRHRVCLCDRDPALLVAANRDAIMQAQQSNKLPPEVAAKIAAASKQPTSRVPDEYARPWETPLRCEVRPGTQTHDFQIP